MIIRISGSIPNNGINVNTNPGGFQTIVVGVSGSTPVDTVNLSVTGNGVPGSQGINVNVPQFVSQANSAISASYAGTASFAFVTLGSIESASYAVYADVAGAGTGSFTGSFIGDATQLSNVQFALFASSASWAPTANGVVSASNQISYAGITDVPADIVSGSVQVQHDLTTGYSASRHIDHAVVVMVAGEGLVGGGNIVASRTFRLDTGSIRFVDGVKDKLNLDSVISSSNQVEFNGISNRPSLVSASNQIDYNGIQNQPSTIAFAQNAEDALFVPFTGVTGKPTLISSSIQIDYVDIQNKPTTIATASVATSASYAPSNWNAVANKPTGIVSASSQVSYPALINIPSGIVSSSVQATGWTVATASVALNAPTLPQGLVSASSQIDHNATTNFDANVHIVHTGVSIVAGNGLSGGGNIAASRTLSLNTGSTHFADGVVGTLNTRSVVSSSVQVSYPALSNIPSGILSSSVQFNALADTTASFALQALSASWAPSAALSTSIVSGALAATLNPADSSFRVNASVRAHSVFLRSSDFIQFGIPFSTINGFMHMPGNGIFRFGDSSGGGSPRIILGSQDATSPALAATTAGLMIRLGNNTGFGSVTASVFVSTGSVVGFVGTASFAATASVATSASFTVSSSFALQALSASWAPAVGGPADWTNITGIPSGIISGSIQVSYPALSNIPAGILSSSAQINTILDADNVVSSSAQISYTGIVGVPSGILSSSVQVSYPALSNIPSGIVSSSVQATTWTVASASVATSASFAPTILPIGSVSSSAQVSYPALANIPVALVSASVQISYPAISNIPTGIVSSSAQINYPAINNIPAGIVSNSVQINYLSTTNIPVGIISSSVQATTWAVASSSVAVTASYATVAQSVLGSITSASYAATASVVLGSITSASYATVAQNVLGSITSASYALTSSYALNGGGGGGSAVRTITTISSSIAIIQNAIVTGSAQLSAGFVLYLVRTNQPLRIRLYSTQQSRDADLTRGTNVEPTGSHNVILDLITTSAELTGTLAPFSFGAMLEEPVSTAIPYSLTNLQTGSVALSASIMFLPLE